MFDFLFKKNKNKNKYTEISKEELNTNDTNTNTNTNTNINSGYQNQIIINPTKTNTNKNTHIDLNDKIRKQTIDFIEARLNEEVVVLDWNVLLKEKTFEWIYAKFNQDRNFCEKFVNLGINIHSKNTGDLQPIHILCKTQYVDLLQKLVDMGADLEAKSKKENRPIHILCGAKTCSKDMLKYLIFKKVSLDIPNERGFYPIHIIVSQQDESILEYFLNLSKACEYINLQDNNLETPLHMACAQGNFKKCQLLTDIDAQFNLKNTKGQNPLHILCEENQFEILRYMLEKFNENFNEKFNEKISLINNKKTNKIIIKSYLTDLDQHGLNVIHHIVAKGPADLIQWTIANVDIKILECETSIKTTLLHILLSNDNHNDINLVKLIVEKFPYMLKQKNINEIYPLHCACRWCHIEIIEYIADGFCTDHKDTFGKTPIDYLEKNIYYKLAQVKNTTGQNLIYKI